ncbi:hypothetical protein EN873_30320 [bacterium M00.F.Ca.ET.230.01.1.1]|nr:hypothetical protein EN873_30320 [bacterium M00.F.Ca.ET.230.01.1.1]
MGRKSKSERIPLSEAWWHFASRRLKQAHAAAEDISAPPMPESYPEDPQEGLALALNAVGAQIEYNSVRAAPRFQMQRELRNKLIAGKRVAWGYRTKPDIQKTIDEIPAYVFRGKIDWERCTVTNDNQKYEGIVVYSFAASDTLRPTAENAVSDARIETHPKESRPGPKSMGPLIIQTYDLLEKSGAFKKFKTMKERATRISDEIKKVPEYKYARGLDIKSICRHLHQHLKFENLRI